jgi:hypothetical protein
MVGAMSDVITNLKDLSHDVTYEVVLRGGERFRGQLAMVENRSSLGQVARFDLADGEERSVYRFEFVSATPVIA